MEKSNRILVEARFTGTVNFTLKGFVPLRQYENCKEFGLGYVEGSDIGTDAEGFDMERIVEGREYWDAYCLLDTEGDKEVETIIIGHGATI